MDDRLHPYHGPAHVRRPPYSLDGALWYALFMLAVFALALLAGGGAVP